MAQGSAKWNKVPSALSLPGRCVSTEPRRNKASSSASHGQLGLFFQLQVNAHTSLIRSLFIVLDDALWNMDAIHGDQLAEF